MPVSSVQVQVLRQIAANRSPDSYVAGATVLHRGDETPRFSLDLDLFHDAVEQVALSAEADATSLAAAGYGFKWLLRTPSFHRALVTVGDDQLKVEWAQDSAFRFYPVHPDETFGYRLHDADAAANKLLALAGRSEVRDFVDVLHLHDSYLTLGALAWAASGKDPGYTPAFLLDQAARHTAYVQDDLDRLALRAPLDLRVLKTRWISALENAQVLVELLPPEEVGCLYLDGEQLPVTPDPKSQEFSSLTRHVGSVRGAWPTVSPDGLR